MPEGSATSQCLQPFRGKLKALLAKHAKYAKNKSVTNYKIVMSGVHLSISGSIRQSNERFSEESKGNKLMSRTVLLGYF